MTPSPSLTLSSPLLGAPRSPFTLRRKKTFANVEIAAPSYKYHTLRSKCYNFLETISTLALYTLAIFVSFYLMMKGHPFPMLVVVYLAFNYISPLVQPLGRIAKEHGRMMEIARIYQKTQYPETDSIKKRLCIAFEAYWAEKELEHFEAAKKIQQDLREKVSDVLLATECIRDFGDQINELQKAARARLEQANYRWQQDKEEGPLFDLTERCTIVGLSFEDRMTYNHVLTAHGYSSCNYVKFKKKATPPLLVRSYEEPIPRPLPHQGSQSRLDRLRQHDGSLNDESPRSPAVSVKADRPKDKFMTEQDVLDTPIEDLATLLSVEP